ncbi:BrnT family toxin [Ramlibacter sp.]|uniref:BrnT family toxin n=1 Tax=Ramlibacter sp. TaxID=1917967 RepID=UPI002CD3699F|nr:BrnT family toxin [Ramlibacter sp.]HWI81519.1 BrnT family toxin [Ramlibacter sp.]
MSNTFECDKKKARRNYDKHQVRFTDAGKAIKVGYSFTQLSPHSHELNEVRNVSITRLLDGRAIVYVWTARGANIRIISARPASRKEREAFNAHLQTFQ